jgi:hypothetical protein
MLQHMSQLAHLPCARGEGAPVLVGSVPDVGRAGGWGECRTAQAVS